ncbi:FlaG family protein [Helicobacter sp.]|uniref:FlaG family protein n=1 Tax=Helicobacter sp. TaxID=218 RepID=UPI0025C15E14|nr:FlaG family protein [Helicobacter sp.]MCI5968623.1 FlaG family protein [Helicobacter sp.]MDY2584446.1 FlaG family protein [Helicobacter sp.]
MNVNESGMNVARGQSNALHSQGTQAPTRTETIQNAIEDSNKEQQIQEQREKLNELAQQLNKELNPLNTNITFGFNEDIEGLYITVSERDTNRVIRKIPSDEAMELMAKMKEVVGIIFSKQA